MCEEEESTNNKACLLIFEGIRRSESSLGWSELYDAEKRRRGSI
jgi:hypothetical protein